MTSAENSVVCDDRSIHVVALPDHRYVLNENVDLDRSEMLRQLEEQLKYRADKVVFLHTDSSLSYGDFIELVDTVYRRDRVLAMVTRRVQELDGQSECLAIRGLGNERWRGSVPDYLVPDRLK